jgi:hypothetical protein
MYLGYKFEISDDNKEQDYPKGTFGDGWLN